MGEICGTSDDETGANVGDTDAGDPNRGLIGDGSVSGWETGDMTVLRGVVVCNCKG